MKSQHCSHWPCCGRGFGAGAIAGGGAGGGGGLMLTRGLMSASPAEASSNAVLRIIH